MAFLKAFLTHGDKEITELLEEVNELCKFENDIKIIFIRQID